MVIMINFHEYFLRLSFTLAKHKVRIKYEKSNKFKKRIKYQMMKCKSYHFHNTNLSFTCVIATYSLGIS